VDAGGGLGISYQSPAQDFASQVRAYAEAILRPLAGLGLHVLLEPGRSIVGPAGALLTRVLYRKTNNGKRFLILDAAMNDLIRPALYQAHHEIAPVVADSTASEVVDIVGPVCESGDFFARDREFAKVGQGELLAVLDAGAYGSVLASNYNTRPRPAEILVEGAKARVVRKRETITDLFRLES
jgi:diaminopimelate decarboxylase